MRYRHTRAFTLIEVLVAMAVFAVLSALAYGSLTQTLIGAEVLSNRMQRVQAIQRTMRLIDRDFMQLAPRPIRDELGSGYAPALTTEFGSGFAVELTRGGWGNPMVLPRGTQQRAAYQLEDDKLIRYHWNVLDHTLSSELIGVTLLDGVESVSFLFMLGNGEWTEQWPPQAQPGPGGMLLRPRAVRIVLNLYDEGELSRIIEVAP